MLELGVVYEGKLNQSAMTLDPLARTQINIFLLIVRNLNEPWFQVMTGNGG